MEFHQAAKLRKEWEEKGNRECEHLQIEQRFLGGYAGDYACKVCGQTFLSINPDSKGEK
ncbi:hypothetical protein [Metabacillus halosaccharovorans]|uniref:hypothetical protein n=1 Tax=Metabacillus halosaccharovorans TaxID=930124 RepID=UPI001C1F974A|nr:hypothetical protein [Metabacillus halosaccharovorans]